MKFNVIQIEISKNNKCAFFCDTQGFTRVLGWKKDASSKTDFKFSKDSMGISHVGLYKICLLNDNKNILCSNNFTSQCSIFNFETMQIIKNFSIHCVTNIELTSDGRNAVIANYNGNLIIIDTKTFEEIDSHM